MCDTAGEGSDGKRAEIMPGKNKRNEKAAMKAKDLEKYFGALKKDSDVLDGIREIILRMRELKVRV